MVDVVHARRKQCSAHLERREDALERRRVQQHVGRLGDVGGVHRVVERIVLDVVVLQRGHERDERARRDHQRVQQITALWTKGV